MKNLSWLAGMCMLSAGVGILISCFLPMLVLVCIEAILLVAAGLLILCFK